LVKKFLNKGIKNGKDEEKRTKRKLKEKKELKIKR
jgi:hypothetical protein